MKIVGYDAKIICVVGKARSGKGYISDIIHKYTGYPVVNVSDIVKQFTGKKASRKDLQLEANKHNNPDWLYNTIKDRLVVSETTCNIVCGIRESHLLDKLEKDFGRFSIIAAKLPDDIRRKRIAEVDKKSDLEILEDDQRDVGLGVEQVLSRANHFIDTSHSLAETEDTIIGLFGFGFII